MKEIIYINANRTGYDIDQIWHTMTVEELIAHLENYDPESPVYLKHDNGYTFGGITMQDFEEEWREDEEEDPA